ncbi:MAG TPA: NTP transferase domain-containing protein [Candidatus Limnocylindria bacterium]|nr:NTP transferase domain-containing protein [Candidatus Limnocylindria bacterium]
MTVAAVLLFPDVERALADTAGRPAVRRMVESAWAGGATPIVVVAADEGGRVASALAGSPAVLAEPAPAAGAAVQALRGLRLASERVTETEAVLLWPGRMVWVDAETMTSLIEAHGADRAAVLRPVYEGEVGWPALLPVISVAQLGEPHPGRSLDELLAALLHGSARLRTVETGDPGTVLDLNTPIDALPPYAGPPAPVAGPAPEWGAAAAEGSDESPLAGPALAPYGQATQEE